MKTPHTPGPWKHQGCEIIQAGKMEAWQFKVAILPTTIDPKSTFDAAAKTIAERDANGRLMAAAPDLLAVIQSLPPIDAPDFRERYVALLNGPARSAIAKVQA